MYEDEQQNEHEILDSEDEHEDEQPVTTSDKAWGFWKWFIFTHTAIPALIGLASCMQQGMR